MQTIKGLTISVAALVMLMGCQTIPPRATATETALCDAWQDSLPSRSRSDTAQTQSEIGRAIAVFEAVCQRLVNDPRGDQEY